MGMGMGGGGGAQLIVIATRYIAISAHTYIAKGGVDGSRKFKMSDRPRSAVTFCSHACIQPVARAPVGSLLQTRASASNVIRTRLPKKSAVVALHPLSLSLLRLLLLRLPPPPPHTSRWPVSFPPPPPLSLSPPPKS